MILKISKKKKIKIHSKKYSIFRAKKDSGSSRSLIYRLAYHDIYLMYNFLKNEKKISSMRSVSLMSEPAYRYFRIFNNKLCAICNLDFHVDKYCKPRNFYSNTFKCNCIVDVYKTETILKNDLFGKKVLPFLTNDFINDIDDKNDLKYVNYYIEKNKYKL